MDGSSSPFLSALRSGDPDRQVDALIELIKLGDPEVVGEILPLVNIDDADVRTEVARALGYLGYEQTSDVGAALVRMLSDSEELVRNAAAESLGGLHYEPAAESLVAGLRTDPSWLVRASIAEALGNYAWHGTPELLDRVRDLHEYGPVRRYAVESLSRTGALTDAEISALIDEFGDDEDIGLQLRLAAYRIGDESQLEWITQAAARLDQAESSILLTGIEYLLRESSPPTLLEDSARIGSILDVVVLRWPLYSRHAEKIRTLLPAH